MHKIYIISENEMPEGFQIKEDFGKHTFVLKKDYPNYIKAAYAYSDNFLAAGDYVRENFNMANCILIPPVDEHFRAVDIDYNKELDSILAVHEMKGQILTAEW